MRIGLCLLLLLGYFPALFGAFIWDDVTFIFDNDLIHRADGLWAIWFSREATDFWPLSYSAFWFLWRMFGSAVVGYHLCNLAVHAANCFWIGKILTRLGWRWAWAAAFLFAVHPVNVESVAWIFQLKTTLAAFFALASLWFWLKGESGGAKRDYFFSFGLFVLALLCKVSVVTWPFVLLGTTLWRQRKLRALDYLRSAPFFLASAVVGCTNLLWYSYDQVSGGEAVRVATVAEKLAAGGYAFWFYWLKAIWPASLTFIYPRWSIDTGRPEVYFPVIAIFLTLAALGAARRWNILAGFSYFLITIFPVLGVADIYFMRYSLVADHWQYLSLIAIVCLWLGAVDQLLEAVGRPSWRFVWYLPVPVLLFLTFQQSGNFRDEETIWRTTLAKNPSAWVAHNNLGALLLGRGEGQEAASHFLKAIEQKPDFADPYNNLGAYFLGQGDRSKARWYFEQSLLVFPFYARALNNLAALELQEGHPQQAIQDEELAVQHLPTYLKGFENLGILYSEQGRFVEARAALQRALSLRPDDPQAAELLQKIEGRKP